MKKAHKNGVINSGFILNEKDLRRIVDTSKEQLQKASENKIYQKYEVRFINGAIEDIVDLDYLFELDNSGSGKISSIIIKVGIEDSDYNIDITFCDINEELTSDSIRYSISGSDRDWLFITLSLIEDRIKPTQRSKFWSRKVNFYDIAQVFIMGIMIGFLCIFLNQIAWKHKYYSFQFDKSWTDYTDNKYVISEELKKISEAKPDLTASQALYEYQKIKEKYDDIRELAMDKYNDESIKWARKMNGSPDSVNTQLIILLAFGFVPSFLIYLYSKLSQKLYPLYVFCWGYSQDEYNKIESRRKFIMITVLTSFFLSVLAGIVVELI